MRCGCLLLLGLLMMAGSSSAQSPEDSLPSVFKGYLKSVAYDAGEIVLFPRNLQKKDAWFAAGGLLLIGGSFLADGSLESEMRKEGNRSFFDHQVVRYGIEPWGSGWYPAAFSAGCYAAGAMSRNRDLRYASLVQMKTLGLSMLVVGGAKLIFQRHRPDEQPEPDASLFDGPFKGLSGNYSFPSGHTFKAFAWASATSSSLEGHTWIKVAVYSLAALTGASRIYEGKHWLSDVTAGAVLGYAFGKFSWRLQKYYDDRTFIRHRKQIR